jgi:hypothetical protein
MSDRFERIRFNFIAGSTFNSVQLPKFDSHQRSEALIQANGGFYEFCSTWTRLPEQDPVKLYYCRPQRLTKDPTT